MPSDLEHFQLTHETDAGLLGLDDLTSSVALKGFAKVLRYSFTSVAFATSSPSTEVEGTRAVPESTWHSRGIIQHPLSEPRL